jgi:hypothetical protein
LAPEALQADEPVFVNDSVTLEGEPEFMELGVSSRVQDTPYAEPCVGVGLAVCAGVGVWVGVAVRVGSGVAVRVGAGVAVGRGVLAGGTAVRVTVAVGLAADVPVAEAVGVVVAVPEVAVGEDGAPPDPMFQNVMSRTYCGWLSQVASLRRQSLNATFVTPAGMGTNQDFTAPRVLSCGSTRCQPPSQPKSTSTSAKALKRRY